jgi:hypothetical protein
VTVPPLLIILIGPSIYEIANVLGGGMGSIQGNVGADGSAAPPQ